MLDRRPIHLPHPALADLEDDFVDAKPGAGSQRQVADHEGGTVAQTGLLLCCGIPIHKEHGGWFIEVLRRAKYPAQCARNKANEAVKKVRLSS